MKSDEDSISVVKAESNIELSSRFGSVCWLNMIASGNNGNGVSAQQASGPPSPVKTAVSTNASATELPTDSNIEANDPNNCCMRWMQKLVNVLKWVFNDFRMRHLVWIKFIFFFQSASMTVLYPYLNLHMKHLGLGIQQVAVINAVIPILFIFTPPLSGFLADKVGNFRVLLSVLTALGGLFALLLLAIPPATDSQQYPENLQWGISCGRPTNRARYQKLMLHGFSRDECDLKNGPSLKFDNVTFTPGTCGYLCPTRSKLANIRPKFAEYKVIWPNRGGGFGIAEIVDVVTLDTKEARHYHEPDVVDNNIFFPMNWTFHLSCDRIHTNDCIFNPIRRAPTVDEYQIQLQAVTSPFRSPDVGPSFHVLSITTPEVKLPVTTHINCGAKELVAQVVSTIDKSSLGATVKNDEEALVDTRFSGCSLHCLVNVPRAQMCNNTHQELVHDPTLTFWTYLTVRTAMGVLTAASLMMFEGAVMATVQEMGGDYGIQRFVGNFGAIVFAPLGGYVIDQSGYEAAIYVYLVLKLIAAVLILLIRLDFKPPGERILSNVSQVAKNAEVVAFLGMMMFAGTFWGFIEAFLFWHLDDLDASRFLMGWTVAVGMVTSLPFLIFSGPITDTIGHMNVIILGMLAYTARMLGYSFITRPVYVYPFEALEGLTMALMMTSAVTYVAKISTPTTIASVMGMMGALFFGVGKGSGSLFGGILMSYIGAPNTFRFFAVNAANCALAYGFFQWLYVRPRKSKSQSSQGSANQTTNSSTNGSNGASVQQVMPTPVATSTPMSPPSPTLAEEKSARLPTTAAHFTIAPKSPTDHVDPGNGNNGLLSTGPRSITGGTRV